MEISFFTEKPPMIDKTSIIIKQIVKSENWKKHYRLNCLTWDSVKVYVFEYKKKLFQRMSIKLLVYTTVH